MKKGFVLSVLFLAGFFHPLFSTGWSQFSHDTHCPVMPGERVKEKFYIDYQGERIYLCCRSCVKAFKKNPAKYLKNLQR